MAVAPTVPRLVYLPPLASVWYFLCICIKRNVFLCSVPRFCRLLLASPGDGYRLLLLHVSLFGHYRTQLHFNERQPASQRWAPVRTCADFFQSLSASALSRCLVVCLFVCLFACLSCQRFVCRGKSRAPAWHHYNAAAT